jgi:hypothetical protein
LPTSRTHGATGKSTFAAALLCVTSTYGEPAKFATFLADRGVGGGNPREDITRLQGRTVACNEVNKSTRFNGALLKTLASGEPYVARSLCQTKIKTIKDVWK